jgi:hypothetical protein
MGGELAQSYLNKAEAGNVFPAAGIHAIHASRASDKVAAEAGERKAAEG